MLKTITFKKISIHLTMNFQLQLNFITHTLCRFNDDLITCVILANFALPEDESDAVVPMFKDVVFTDLNREEAVKVVELYNKVAKEKGYGKKHEERKMKKFKGANQRGGFKGNQKPNQNQG